MVHLIFRTFGAKLIKDVFTVLPHHIIIMKAIEQQNSTTNEKSWSIPYINQLSNELMEQYINSSIVYGNCFRRIV